ncbi:MAG: four helix bundle protein [Candidatus Omnitrophica bacterium]|nr:four helix bundle protein [Candidatus Omnitrophota bacterium]
MDDLAVTIYEATRPFPREEQHGLVAQMRRAGVSVPANIAEGSSRSSKKEYAQFLSIAKGSMAELEYYLHLSKRLGYFDEAGYRRLDDLLGHAAKTLQGLYAVVVEQVRGSRAAGRSPGGRETVLV